MTAENTTIYEAVNLLKDGGSLVPYDLPLFNSVYIKLSPKQIMNFEETVKADFSEPEHLTTFLVLSYEDTSLPISPTRVTIFPTIETDCIPSNRAIAKIGMVYEHWNVFAQVMKTGEFNYFDFKDLSLLPVFTDKNGKHFVEAKEKYQGHSLYNKTPYTRCVTTINYAGDADFTGSEEPNKVIPFYNIDGSREYLPISKIGVTLESATKMFNASKKIWDSKEVETTKYVKSVYNSLPHEAKQLIDEALVHEQFLESHNIWRTFLFKNKRTDYDLLTRSLIIIGEAVNAEFAKNVNNSETMKAVDDYVVALEEMYQEALPQYKR